MADFFSGLASGLGQGMQMKQARANRELQQQKMAIEQQKLGMEQEKMDMLRTEMDRKEAAFARKQQMNYEMSPFIEGGDLEGAAKVVSKYDPEAALSLRKWKVDYDKSLAEMANKNADTRSKEVTMQKDVGEVIGNLSYAILKEPDFKSREFMYENLKKYAGALDVKFSFVEKYGKEADMQLQMFTAHALPARFQFEMEQKNKMAQSELGKLQADALNATTPEARENLQKAMDSKINEIIANTKAKLQDQLSQVSDREAELRKRWNDLTSSYTEAQTALNGMEKLAEMSTGSSDMALIISLNKVLDPRSVVRQEEFDATAKSGGFAAQAQVFADAFLTGNKLTPKLRQQLMETARANFKGRQEVYERQREVYTNIAVKDGLDVNKAIPDYTVNRLKSKEMKQQEIMQMNPDQMQKTLESDPELQGWLKGAMQRAQEKGYKTTPEELLKRKLMERNQ